jgi:hypothetical protein
MSDVVGECSMTEVAAEASHEIAAWIELSVRLIEALSVMIRWKVPGLGRGML